MDYTGNQEHYTSQSDDGSLSDVSSTIAPNKTTYTTIKGWGDKYFAGINDYDKSRRLLRNADNGFEIKTAEDGSSDELESVGYAVSTASTSGCESDMHSMLSYDNSCIRNLQSSGIEDNVADNTGRHIFEESHKTMITVDKPLNECPGFNQEQITETINNTCISPLASLDKQLGYTFDNKLDYNPRIKKSLMKNIAGKISTSIGNKIAEESRAIMMSNSIGCQGKHELIMKETIITDPVLQKQKPKWKIRAKTVADKRKLSTEPIRTLRPKTKQIFSNKKNRVDKDLNISKRGKRLKRQMENNTLKQKAKYIINPDKTSQFNKEWIDEQGVITYGREKQLSSILNKSFLRNVNLLHSKEVIDRQHSPKIGMILNIGLFRPLCKEAYENLKELTFDNHCNITADYALFASSAVQNSFKRPSIVRRILVPVIDDTLTKIMHCSKIPRHETGGVNNNDGCISFNIQDKSIPSQKPCISQAIMRITNDPAINIKQCYVQLERNQCIEQMSTERGVNCDCLKCSKKSPNEKESSLEIDIVQSHPEELLEGQYCVNQKENSRLNVLYENNRKNPVLIRKDSKHEKLIKKTLPSKDSTGPLRRKNSFVKRKREGTKLITKPKKLKRKKKERNEKKINTNLLRKKINNLRYLQEKIKLRELKSREGQSQEPYLDVYFDSDSDSLVSDDDRDIPLDGSNYFPITGTKEVKIVVHNIKEDAKSKEVTPSELPQHLYLKKPREGPCPERALVSLTPGVGYIPVVEFVPQPERLIVPEPFKPHVHHLFLNCDHAAGWLNRFFLDKFNFQPEFNMQWLMMRGRVIRCLKPFDENIFKSKAESLVIRPSGLDLGDYEQQNPEELSGHERVESHDTDVEMAELFKKLWLLLIPTSNPTLRAPEITILRIATLAIQAQKELEKDFMEVKKLLERQVELRKFFFNSFLSAIEDPKKKRKAVKLMAYIKDNAANLKNNSDEYLNKIGSWENTLLLKLSTINPAGLVHEHSEFRPTPLLHRMADTRTDSTNSNQAAEGMSALESSQTDIRVLPASDNVSEIIEILDSENEQEIIEIDSDEEEVIWLPNIPPKAPVGDDDVEIVSTTLKRRRSKVRLPKPTIQRVKTTKTSRNTAATGAGQRSGPAPPVSKHPDLFTQFLMAVKRLNLSPSSSNLRGRRTDPVGDEFLANRQPTPQLIPIAETSRVNIINTSFSPLARTSTENNPASQRSVTTSLNNEQEKVIESTNTTPLENILGEKMGKFRGKSVLLSKIGGKFRISKLPSSYVTPLNETATLYTAGTSSQINASKKVPCDRENTVSVHYEDQETGQMRIIKIVPSNNAELDRPLMPCGPKMRIPKGIEQTVGSGIKVLFPKRR